jgi:hypothetical protein
VWGGEGKRWGDSWVESCSIGGGDFDPVVLNNQIKKEKKS